MKLTILMYHKVDEPSPAIRHAGNVVSPREFEQQLDALLAWGYQTVGFDQWLDERDRGTSAALPPKPLILTFDDGYACFDEHAWPRLRARGMHATVFLVSSQIGGTNAWESDEIPLPLLSARRIHALQDEGVQFGSHSVTHRPLARIPIAEALDELTASRTALTELLGSPVNVVAYPFSNQSADVRELARRAGYRCAVRGKGRMNWPHTDPFGLRRIKIEPGTTPARLRLILARERYFRIL